MDVAVAGAAVVVLAAAAPYAGSAAGVGVLAFVLGAFVAVWLTAGRRALEGGPLAPVVAVVLVAVCAIGALVTPAFATVQVIALPLAWLIAGRFAAAVVLNGAVVLAIGTGYALGAGLLPALAVEGVSLAFSLGMGIWIGRIERRSEERRVLVERLTAAQAEIAALGREAGSTAERERLARELHDTLTQSLAGMVMLAERARSRHPEDESLAVLEDAARAGVAEARALVAGAAGVPLTGGLAVALQLLGERYRREAGLEVTVDAAVAVPRGLEAVLLRCAQEGLANVRKHAGARSAAVVVRVDDGAAVLRIEDDGRGPTGGQGFGLGGMRDRIAVVGGAVALAPLPGGGAVLTVRVPMDEAVRA